MSLRLDTKPCCCDRNEPKDPATAKAELILHSFQGALALCRVMVSTEQPNVIVIQSRCLDYSPTLELRQRISEFAKGFEVRFEELPALPNLAGLFEHAIP